MKSSLEFELAYGKLTYSAVAGGVVDMEECTVSIDALGAAFEKEEFAVSVEFAAAVVEVVVVAVVVVQ